jgi:hypothetical protein
VLSVNRHRDETDTQSFRKLGRLRMVLIQLFAKHSKRSLNVSLRIPPNSVLIEKLRVGQLLMKKFILKSTDAQVLTSTS